MLGRAGGSIMLGLKLRLPLGPLPPRTLSVAGQQLTFNGSPVTLPA